MSPGNNGGGGTAPFKDLKDCYMKFGHFCVVPEGKLRLNLHGVRFRLTSRKNLSQEIQTTSLILL